MAPSRVKQLRTMAAKASGMYVGIGQTHIAMRMTWAQHQDPLNFIFRQQVKLWFRLFRCFPKDGQGLLKIAWQQTLGVEVAGCQRPSRGLASFPP